MFIPAIIVIALFFIIKCCVDENNYKHSNYNSDSTPTAFFITIIIIAVFIIFALIGDADTY